MAAVTDSNGPSNGLVRVMARKAGRDRSPRPARFSVATSTTPDSPYASRWEEAKPGVAGMLGQRIAAKTRKPVGIIFMQSMGGKDVVEPELKHWIPADALQQLPSLAEDYKQLAGMNPGTEDYAAFGRSYIAAWKKYWSEYIPTMIAEKRVPDGVAWGTYPSFGGKITTEASQSYNVLTCSFTPASVKGIIFLTGEAMFKQDQGANFSEQFTVLANSWKAKFDCPDAAFCYTVPSPALAAKVSKPGTINGRSMPLEINNWPLPNSKDKDAAAAVNTQMLGVIDRIVGEVYK
jgi:hypothetical protein